MLLELSAHGMLAYGMTFLNALIKPNFDDNPTLCELIFITKIHKKYFHVRFRNILSKRNKDSIYKYFSTT